MATAKQAAQASVTPTPKKASPSKTAPAKAATKKAATKQATARKSAAKAAPAQRSASATAKAPSKSAATKKVAAQKVAAKKTAPVSRVQGGVATPIKSTAKAPAKSAAKKAAPAAKASPAKKTAPAKKAAPATKGAPATKAAAKAAAPAAKRPSAAKSASYAVKGNEDPWTATELTAVRAELQHDANTLRAEIEAAEEDLQGLIRDGGDGAGDDQADAGAKTFEREHEISLTNNARDMLLQIERALQRLDDGTYGVCENCGEPIGKGRLQAAPRATLCIPCKQREERR